MTLNIENKIKIILSLDEKILLPSSSIDTNQIFYKLFNSHQKFLKDLNFKQICSYKNYYESDVLEHIVFDLHLSKFVEPVYIRNEYYKLISPIRENIYNQYKYEIEENKTTFDIIKEEYLNFFSERYPFFKI